jgi:hypothetical protein
LPIALSSDAAANTTRSSEEEVESEACPQAGVEEEEVEAEEEEVGDADGIDAD